MSDSIITISWKNTSYNFPIAQKNIELYGKNTCTSLAKIALQQAALQQEPSSQQTLPLNISNISLPDEKTVNDQSQKIFDLAADILQKTFKQLFTDSNTIPDIQDLSKVLPAEISTHLANLSKTEVNSLLFQAASTCRLDIVQSILTTHHNPDLEQSTLKDAFLAAIEHNSLDIAMLLLKKIEINQTSDPNDKQAVDYMDLSKAFFGATTNNALEIITKVTKEVLQNPQNHTTLIYTLLYNAMQLADSLYSSTRQTANLSIDSDKINPIIINYGIILHYMILAISASHHHQTILSDTLFKAIIQDTIGGKKVNDPDYIMAKEIIYQIYLSNSTEYLSVNSIENLGVALCYAAIIDDKRSILNLLDNKNDQVILKILKVALQEENKILPQLYLS